MPKVSSAGLLMYKKEDEIYKVFLVKPGGPYFRKKDLGSWDIPKGKVEPGEALLAAAKREFKEETGYDSKGPYYYLGNVLTKGKGKKVHIWIFEGHHKAGKIKSNMFTMEWPPRSGKQARFPEIERGEWFTLDEAEKKIFPYQRPLIIDFHFLIDNV